MNIVESIYGNALRYSFAFLNPFKKLIIETQCEVHKFINHQALEILKNEFYMDKYYFYHHFIYDINEGAVWADQDFKSSNHFYNPRTEKGLYGRRNAMDLSLEYLEKCCSLIKIGDYHRAMFYFGATLHLIQDMTIPQHANVRLLDNHRQYENFIKKTYQHMDEFKAETGAYQLNCLQKYMKFNARVAMKIYRKFKSIKEDKERFYKMTACILPLAERTTAGFMIHFFNRQFQ